MRDADDAVLRSDRYAPMTFIRLAAVYLALWLVCGALASLFHLICAPDYIDIPTRVTGGVANLFGPWARPLATGWPNAGKPPHAPSAFIGVAALVLIGVVVLLSLTARERWVQYVCIAAFVPLIAMWIGIGFLELMVCAS